MEKIDEEELLNRMIDYLSKHVGEETTTACIIDEVYGRIDFNDEMEIDSKLKKLAPKRGFKLDSSKYKYLIIGLSQNIPFVIKKKK